MKSGIQKEVAALGTVLAAVDGLKKDQQQWVFAAAMSNLGLASTPLVPPGDSGEPAPAGAATAAATGKVPTAKEFMKQKNPQSDVQRALCLGYYLTKYRDKPHFKTKDLAKLNIDAATGSIGNLSQAVANATKQSHYLAPAGGGAKQVSAHGEDIVAALPDQAAVRQVDANKPKKRKVVRKRAKAK